MDNVMLFCELKFLIDFFNQPPNSIGLEKVDREKRKLWNNFLDLILASNITMDASIQELNEHKDCELLKYIVKRWGESKCELICQSKDFFQGDDLSEQLKTNDIFKGVILLLSRPTESYKRITNSYGLLAFDNESIYKSQKYFNLDEKSVEKGELHISFWKFLNELKHPCNSLTIIDNFLLQNDWDIEKNIIPIINYLAPDKLKIPFHISIFSFDTPNNKIIDFERRYISVKEKLQKIRPNLDIRLGIFLKNKDEHDRYILTNYISIDSGAGFDITSSADKTKHGTAISIKFPKTSLFISENSDDIFLKVKKIEKKIFASAVSNNNFKNYWGQQENRLLEN